MPELTDYERYSESSPARARQLRQEKLILKVTHALWETLATLGMKRSDLAAKMQRSAGFVSHVLAGDRNLTLRTLADIAGAMECEVDFRLRQRSASTAPLYSIDLPRRRSISPSTPPAQIVRYFEVA